MVHAVTDTDDFKNQVHSHLPYIWGQFHLSCFQLAAAGEKLVVVDFFATWYCNNFLLPQYEELYNAFRCGPCKMIAPVLEELNKTLEDVVFIKVFSILKFKSWTCSLVRRTASISGGCWRHWGGGRGVQDHCHAYFHLHQEERAGEFGQIIDDLIFLKTFFLHWQRLEVCFPNVFSTGCRIEGS